MGITSRNAETVSCMLTSRGSVTLCFGSGALSGDSESSLMIIFLLDLRVACFFVLGPVLVCLVLALGFCKDSGFGILDNFQIL